MNYHNKITTQTLYNLQHFIKTVIVLLVRLYLFIASVTTKQVNNIMKQLNFGLEYYITIMKRKHKLKTNNTRNK